MHAGRGMTELRVETLIERNADSYLTGVTDLDVRTNANGDAILYAVSRSGGVISAFDTSGNGTPRLNDHQALTTETEQIGFLSIDRDAFLATFSPQADSTRLYQINASGDMVGQAAQVSDGSGAMSSVVQMDVDDTSYLFVTDSGSGTLDTFRIASGGAISQVDNGSATFFASSIARAAPGSNQFLLAADADGRTVHSYAVGSGGNLVERGSTGADDGLGVAGVSALEHVALPDGDYVIVTARDSSSISVLRIEANGSLTPVDHVIDDLDTRFQHVTALETVTANDRAFVIVGGADDGVTLFELLPGGRLLHHHTIPDGFDISLANVASIAAHATSGNVEVYIGSGTETGVTQLSVDLGPVSATRTGTNGDNTLTGSGSGEILAGRRGNDRIEGRGGDDILMDGDGADTLIGGNGADIFVMEADDRVDEILDFNPQVDRIDLSAWPMLRNLDQVGFQATSNGAILRYRDEVLRIRSADGTPLSRQDVLTPEVLSLTRVPAVEPQPADAQVDFIGNGGADRLVGNSLDNVIEGRGGRDTLRGQDGNDILRGDNGNDVLNGGDGNDTLNGGGGNDRIWAGEGDRGNDRINGGTGNDIAGGGAGNDTINGGGGSDTLFGGSGADLIRGGNGGDVVWAGSWADTIEGRSGNDTLGGGWGNDGIWGGGGHDVIYGGRGPGADHVAGGAGRDTVFSGAGTDTIHGGGGGDLIFNGPGSDRVTGGAGNDTIWGGPGGDTLTGGANADEFRFVAGNGTDTITDFDPGTDMIVFEIAGIGFGDLEVSDTATGVDIAYGGDTISLQGLSNSDLGAEDFLFV